MFTNRTPQYHGKPLNSSIACIEQVCLGGLEQSILIRGTDVDSPILLFLHGGPGEAQIGYARHYQSELEKHFIVVNWDQRGAGLSYTHPDHKNPLTMTQLINDTIELIAYLLERFSKQKLFIAGHGFGSMIGILTAKLIPEDIYAYIGVGQLVDINQSDITAYHLALLHADLINHHRALNQLHKIGAPPYADHKKYFTLLKWLSKFGAVTKEGSKADFLAKGKKSTEYRFRDWRKYEKGRLHAFKQLLPELIDFNLYERITHLTIPTYFCIGRYDFVSSYEMQEDYVEVLETPHKEIIWFDKSAHYPHFEEPTPFLIACLKIKRDTLAASGKIIPFPKKAVSF
ncbi:alpha/beta hydrolase [Hazenella sp. IB182357]|uniref:Alpha/beta hydrolase n=1 Tax=Polycladospora coralii TaxID=2771432 RepID=A0A926NCP0_9BACL|nr:alpha/beta hydrolase [Polycladospora coralii]MBD1373390.1 alpha/beta hydrolase [Polycladospora coralii]MBS7531612.1 alpha/beta hydrolase [Polycladospora coralii]